MTKPLTTRQAFSKLIKQPDWWKRLKDGRSKNPTPYVKHNRGNMIIDRHNDGKLSDGFMSDLLRECGCKETVKSGWEV